MDGLIDGLRGGLQCLNVPVVFEGVIFKSQPCALKDTEVKTDMMAGYRSTDRRYGEKNYCRVVNRDLGKAVSNYVETVF